jgi:microcystin-dependent protein
MQPFLGQITLYPYNFAPNGWMFCQGQILPISQFAALFSLLGTQFGGNGTSNFALPDLRGRVPNGQGQGPGLSAYTIGDVQGDENVTLTSATSPPHTHGLTAFTTSATSNSPSGALPAQGHGSGRGGGFAVNTYTAPGTAVSLAPGQVGPVTGGGAAHNNLQPYLTLNWCIALTGIYPSRN